jgi:O-antigen ligase
VTNATDIREKLTAGSLYVATAALPFSILVCHGALIIFLILWVTEGNWERKLIEINNSKWLIVLGVFVLITLASVLYSNDRARALLVLDKKLFFFVIPFAIATSTYSFSLKDVKVISFVLCISTFVALVYCYSHSLYQLNLYNEGKIGGDSITYLAQSGLNKGNINTAWLFFSYVSLSGALHLHPTYLAMYAAYSLVFLIIESRKTNFNPRWNILTYFLAAFFSFSIVFLAARIVLLVVCLFYIVLLAYDFFAKNQSLKRIIIPAMLIGSMAAGVMINPVTKYRQVEEIISNGIYVEPNANYSNSTGIRASLWLLSAQAYLNTNSLIGTGVGDVEASVAAAASKQKITNSLHTNDPHNQYLFIIISTGIVGLTSFLAFLLFAIFKAWQNRDLLFLSFIFLVSIVAMTESVLEMQKGTIFFTIFFSIMMSTKSVHSNVKALSLARA